VKVTPNFQFDDKGFALKDFHEVNKQYLSIDLLAAMQAQHKRFNVGPNSNHASGSVAISSADGGSYTGADSRGTSGDVLLASGTTSSGASGFVAVTTGNSLDTSGSMHFMAGAAGVHGGAITLAAGEAAHANDR
jgi:hypothetical protein